MTKSDNREVNSAMANKISSEAMKTKWTERLTGRRMGTWTDLPRRMHHAREQLTLGRFEFPDVLPDGADLVDTTEERGCKPTPGDIDRTGTLGGGPGSAPGERRWI